MAGWTEPEDVESTAQVETITEAGREFEKNICGPSAQPEQRSAWWKATKARMCGNSETKKSAGNASLS